MSEEAALVGVGAEPQTSVEGMILAAIERGVPVETMERLLAMSERVKAEQARSAYFEALSAFQEECPLIAKSKAVTVYSQKGNYQYHYAPLESIVQVVRSILRKHGLSYRFDTRFEADPPAQIVFCTVYHTAGHAEASEFRTPVDQGARMNDMQKSASAQTYAKRYAFVNALGILTGDEDDDGRSGGGDSRETRRPNVAPPPPSPETERLAQETAPVTGQPVARGRVISLKKGEGPVAATALDVIQQSGYQVSPTEASAGEVDIRAEMRAKCQELVFQYWKSMSRDPGNTKPNGLQIDAFLNGAAKKKHSKKFMDLDMAELDSVFQSLDQYTQRVAVGGGK